MEKRKVTTAYCGSYSVIQNTKKTIATGCGISMTIPSSVHSSDAKIALQYFGLSCNTILASKSKLVAALLLEIESLRKENGRQTN